MGLNRLVLFLSWVWKRSFHEACRGNLKFMLMACLAFCFMMVMGFLSVFKKDGRIRLNNRIAKDVDWKVMLK